MKINYRVHASDILLGQFNTFDTAYAIYVRNKCLGLSCQVYVVIETADKKTIWLIYDTDKEDAWFDFNLISINKRSV